MLRREKPCKQTAMDNIDSSISNKLLITMMSTLQITRLVPQTIYKNAFSVYPRLRSSHKMQAHAIVNEGELRFQWTAEEQTFTSEMMM